jgi:hypothetical protein
MRRKFPLKVNAKLGAGIASITSVPTVLVEGKAYKVAKEKCA